MVKEDIQKDIPPVGTIGEAGGSMMPTVSSGLVYNPDTIKVRTYKEMEDDAQIKAVLTLIKAPLKKAVWSIDCEDQDIANFCKDCLIPLWSKLINHLCNALNFGHQAFEKVWEEEGSYWKIRDFIDLYPDSVTYKKKEGGRFDGIEQFTTHGTVTIPADKCFVFSSEKRFGNPYGRSKLRSAYMYWFIDKFTYDFENVYFERYSQPIIVGHAPVGKTQTGTSVGSTTENISGLLKKLEGLRRSSCIVLPSEVDAITKAKKWSVEFLEAQRRGGDFRQRHEYLDLMKARAIFAPELVFSAPYAGSSYALAREHSSIFMSAEEAILEEIKMHIDLYILRDLVRYNFGQRAPLAYWAYESIAPEVKNLLRDLIMAMVAGDIIRPDASWIAETLGLKLREEASKETEKEIKKETQGMMLKAIKDKKAEDGITDEGEEEEEPKQNIISQLGSSLTGRKPPPGLPPGISSGIMPTMKPVVPPTMPPAIPEGMDPNLMAGIKPDMIQNIIGQLGANKAAGLPPETPPSITKPQKKKKLNRSQAAFKRWATQPTRKDFRSGKSWEKNYGKGLFEDVQAHYLYGTRKHWTFDEASDQYIHFTEIENFVRNQKVQEKTWGKVKRMINDFLRRK